MRGSGASRRCSPEETNCHSCRVLLPSHTMADEIAATLVQALQVAVQQLGQSGAFSAGMPGHRKALDIRSFEKMEKFESKEDQWQDWAFVFGIKVSAPNPSAFAIMEDVKSMDSNVATADIDLDPGNTPSTRTCLCAHLQESYTKYCAL